MRLTRLLAGALVALAGAVAPAGAQRPVLRPATPPVRTSPSRPDTIPQRVDTIRTRGDTLRTVTDTLRGRRDTVTARDTAAKANLAAPDSVMQRLLNMPGYQATQYQGRVITFDALTRAIELTKNPVIVADSQLVKSDSSIRYQGTGKAVQVKSTEKGRNVFVIPGQAPIFSSGAASYDIGSRRASVANVSTSLVQGGQNLYITGEKVVKAGGRDSAGLSDAVFYVRDGTVTACDDSIPDYYFKAGEIKRTGSFVVARPAVLYIGDVPVMWLPFLFQDVRGGRHSGLLVPNLGVSDFVRNSPSYRRNVEGLGYYVAISDYLDAQASFDWRSSAGVSDLGDQGYTRYNGELRYKWLDRYVDGYLAVSQTLQSTAKNLAVSLSHAQQFTRNSSLSAQLNYVSNTVLQRQTTINPYTASATIRSSANYHQKLGPLDFSLGGQRTQYPGRSLVEQNLPSLQMSSTPISLGDWLVWTPSLSYSSTQSLGLDQPSNLGLFLRRGPSAAGVDTIFGDTLKRNSYSSSLSFGTPLQIFGYLIGNQFSISSRRNDFPELELVTSVDSGVVTNRIYSSTYSTFVDWTPSFTLPPVARNNFNLTPSLTLANVGGGAFWVRNERTGGQWVHQKKRLMFGLSASPTLFGLFGGFGPFTRIRHSITPMVGFSYAPAAHLDDDYLAAIGATRWSSVTQSPTAYLGELAQSAVNFQLSTNLEAKTRSTNDSNPEAGDKLKLLSLTFGGLTYDFERAKATHSKIRGLTSPSFNYTVRSDLLPGFDLGVEYSLWEGSNMTDSAKFSPFRERVTSSFSFSNTANPFAVFSRLFGKAIPAPDIRSESNEPPPDDRYARQVASQPVAGRAAHNAAFLPTVTKGWNASFTFTSSRQRPVSGANVVAFDPTVRCQQYNTPSLRLLFDQCVEQQRANPAADAPPGSGLPGSTIYSVPNSASLGTNLNFNLTEHWAASYQTNYDFELKSFATQIMSLQRDLHDWRAIFAFTQSPNGAFAFNFLISLKAEPELKFDYHKATYRNTGGF